MDLVFKETSVFTRQIKDLLSDDEYKEFQQHLVEMPTAGPVIKDTGGCRKVRWALQNNNGGKSGGMRAIYYWIRDEHQIYLLLAYEKSSQDTLSSKQKKILKALVRDELQVKENDDG